MTIDHPIFNQSIKYIQSELGQTGLDPLEQKVLERLIHTSGDFTIKPLLKFSQKACQLGVDALRAGAPILTDTSMARAAVVSMTARTLSAEIKCVLDWAPKKAQAGQTRIAIGMRAAWHELSTQFVSPYSPIVVIGSAPTGLDALLDLIGAGLNAPSLIIAMPVGFIGVKQSKFRLSQVNCPQIRLEGTRGGAALAGAAVNALLKAAVE